MLIFKNTVRFYLGCIYTEDWVLLGVYYNHKAVEIWKHMDIESSTYGQDHRFSIHTEGDDRLHEIVDGVHHYLDHVGRSWIYITIGRSYYLKCNRSWDKVNIHLEKFLLSPRNNYSLLMVVLEQEIHKFPPHSYYGKRLQELAQFISLGPQFKH